MSSGGERFCLSMEKLDSFSAPAVISAILSRLIIAGSFVVFVFNMSFIALRLYRETAIN